MPSCFTPGGVRLPQVAASATGNIVRELLST